MMAGIYPSSNYGARGRHPKAGKGSSGLEDSHRAAFTRRLIRPLANSWDSQWDWGALESPAAPELHPSLMHWCTVPSKFWPTTAAHSLKGQGLATYVAWWDAQHLRRAHGD